MRQEELEAFFRLSEFAFQFERSDEERQKEIAEADHRDFWACFEDGKLTAKLRLIPFHTWVGGKLFALGGIASVSTWPEYRRQGFVADLLRNSLKVMRENGQMLSGLNPFAFAFYRKYGWESFCEIKQYEIPTAQLPKYTETSGRMERTEDTGLLNRLYEADAVRYNGMLQRDETWWKKLQQEWQKGTAAVWTNDEGVPQGYIRYKISGREMELYELVALEEEARRALWRFIGNHDSMIERVKWKAPADDILPFLLPNPRFKQEVIPYFMVRIVDAPAFLAAYPFTGLGVDTEIRLTLRDEHAEWNNGSFLIAIDGTGKAEVTSCESIQGREAMSLSCDIQTLSAMLISRRGPDVLHQIGNLQGDADAVARLTSLIPAKLPFLNDGY